MAWWLKEEASYVHVLFAPAKNMVLDQKKLYKYFIFSPCASAGEGLMEAFAADADDDGYYNYYCAAATWTFEDRNYRPIAANDVQDASDSSHYQAAIAALRRHEESPTQSHHGICANC